MSPLRLNDTSSTVRLCIVFSSIGDIPMTGLVFSHYSGACTPSSEDGTAAEEARFKSVSNQYIYSVCLEACGKLTDALMGTISSLL
jgi:hypothetical protein